MVVGYIIWDLRTGKTVSSPTMAYDHKIDKIIEDGGGNHGERQSRHTILDNTNYLLNKYDNLFVHE
jgi:hypothetical protein